MFGFKKKKVYVLENEGFDIPKSETKDELKENSSNSSSFNDYLDDPFYQYYKGLNQLSKYMSKNDYSYFKYLDKLSSKKHSSKYLDEKYKYLSKSQYWSLNNYLTE